MANWAPETVGSRTVGSRGPIFIKPCHISIVHPSIHPIPLIASTTVLHPFQMVYCHIFSCNTKMNTHSSKPAMHCNVHALGLTWEGHHLPGGFRTGPTQQLICNAQFHQGSSINACKGRTAEQCIGSYVSSYERELLCHSRLATDAEGIILPLSVPKLPPTASVQLVFPFELHPHLSGSSLKFKVKV